VSWAERLQKATFRGVPFGVVSSDGEGGRRLVVHEYPMRDKPFVEDMGRKRRAFTIQAHVVGKDYMDRRDALEKALDASGPGILVHPWRGSMSVCVGDWKVQEDAGKLGAAVYSISFVESGAEENPQAVARTRDQVGSKADRVKSVSEGMLGKAWTIAGQSSNVLARGVSKVRSVVSTASRLAYSSTNPAALASTLTSLAGVNLSSLPGYNLASQLQGLFADATDLYGFFDTRQHRQRASDMLAFRSSWSPQAATVYATPSATQAAANDEALAAHLRLSSLAEACRSASLADLATASEVVETRDTLLDAMDEELNATQDDQVHFALADLRTAVVRDMAEKAAAAPQSVEYNPPAPMPTLAIAHALYGDADRAAEIETRNAIRHPGFARGPLAVLRG